MMIVVCSLRASHEQVQLTKASHVVSILSPNSEFPQFASVDTERHLKLSFNDIASPTPGLAAPQSGDMQKLLNFIRGWDQARPMVIHCWAGVSRSTAAAYIAACLLKPKKDEVELAETLRAASPSATPNPMLVSLADHALAREGRMRSAIAAIGRGADAFEGGPFRLEL
jgi:predicted protein tyrosine phosphatase